ncbi:uncharacterized protein LOC116010822 [Ipomoea triloba]|uniref:uncharacterized protein LOC116010822 n=1 Tax=Ipomoea triloba TaxID=35885 RepID=UPI00125D54BA|nr:uncharacterized protein LOC116010822 [Ipomoea triloba]
MVLLANCFSGKGPVRAAIPTRAGDLREHLNRQNSRAQSEQVRVENPPANGVQVGEAPSPPPPIALDQPKQLGILGALTRLANQDVPGDENPKEVTPNEPRNRRERRYDEVQRQIEEHSIHESSGESPVGRGRRPENIVALARQVRDLQNQVNGNHGDAQSFLRACPFSRDIMAFQTPTKFKLPKNLTYDGTGDPREHLLSFQARMQIHEAEDPLMCKAFLTTLTGSAQRWCMRLPEHSVSYFTQLAELFLTNYAAYLRPKKNFMYLSGVKQDPNESLRSFLVRWQKEVHTVDDLDNKTMLILFMQNLRFEKLYTNLHTEWSSSYAQAIQRTNRHADAEDAIRQKRIQEGGLSRPKKPRLEETRAERFDKSRLGRQETSWNPERSGVLLFRQQSVAVQERGNPSQFGEGNRDKGKQSTKGNEEANWKGKNIINMIIRGPEGGDSAGSRKAWARQLYIGAIYGREANVKKECREPITFTDDNLPLGAGPHRDALVIAIDIVGTVVRRVLEDTGSSVNVLYLDTFKKLRLDRDILKLLVELGTYPNVTTVEMEFVVVQLECSYNAIIEGWVGRFGSFDISEAFMHEISDPYGAGVVQSDQRIARGCYLQSCCKMGRSDLRIHTITKIEDMREHTLERPEPAVELEEVEIDPIHPERRARIRKDLPNAVKRSVVQVLRKYKKIFTWGSNDMSGVDRSIFTHRLVIDPAYRPVVRNT